MPSAPSRDLCAVPNPRPGRDHVVSCETSELTCLCPMTGQPDFATVHTIWLPRGGITTEVTATHG